jgi:hypothetical protein
VLAGESGVQEPLFEDAEVQERSQRQGLEAVPQEGVLVDDHPPGLNDTSEEGSRRLIQDDEVDLIGAQVLRHDADQVEAGSHRGAVLDGGGELARHAAAVARLAAELAILDDDLAAQDHDRRPAVHLPAVPRTVVGAWRSSVRSARQTVGSNTTTLTSLPGASTPLRG